MNLEQLRAFCLSLPGTTEDVKWEDHLCFSVGGKMYYVTSFTHPSSSLKVPDDEFDIISASDGIIPAPYMARNKWVQVAHLDRFSRQEWEHYIRQSYELVKSKLPKRVQQEIESGKVKSEMKKSETKKSETKKSETKKSETKKSETKKSETKKAGTKKPEKKKSETKKAETKKSSLKKANKKKAAVKKSVIRKTGVKKAAKKKTAAKKTSAKKVR